MADILYLTKELFEEGKIWQALEDYRALADIHIEIGNDNYICIFKDCKYDVKRTIMEFENYLIDLSNSGKVRNVRL